MSLIIEGQKETKSSKVSNKNFENTFIEKLKKHLNTKEVVLDDGSKVSNMDAIIDNMMGRALDGDVAIIKLIKDLLNSK